MASSPPSAAREKPKRVLRVSGFLDPIVEKMPNGTMKELAELLNVDRKSVYLWQKRGKEGPISKWNKVRIDDVCRVLKISTIFST